MQPPGTPKNDSYLWISLWIGILFGLAFPAAAASLFSGFLLAAIIIVPLLLLGFLCAKFSEMRERNKALNRRWENENNDRLRQAAARRSALSAMHGTN